MRVKLATIKTRADFLRAARGVRRSQTSLTLELTPTPEAGRDPDTVRYGVTASRKVGGAVERNRAKRRLREAARAVLPLSAVAGNDYVLVARRETLVRPFDGLLADLARALEAAHARQRKASGEAA
jgi:ribonuclease P protein component